MEASGTDDQQLLARIAVDDQNAFRVLYERHWPGLLDAAYRRLKDPDLAKDIVQEVFARLYNVRKTLVLTTTASAYLHTVLKYKVLDEVRRQLVRNRYREEWVRHSSRIENPTEPGELFEENEMQVLIDEAGSQMPARCREVFFLRHREQLSYREIAQRLSLSEKTVEGHLHRARKILKRYFRNYPMIFMILIASVLS